MSPREFAFVLSAKGQTTCLPRESENKGDGCEPRQTRPECGIGSHASETTQRFKQSIDDITYLLQSPESVSDAAFRRALCSLEAVPLPTGEFALAKCRLANAWVATNWGELGAASYELRLLVRWLKKQLSIVSTRGVLHRNTLHPSIGKC